MLSYRSAWVIINGKMQSNRLLLVGGELLLVRPYPQPSLPFPQRAIINHLMNDSNIIVKLIMTICLKLLAKNEGYIW
jgi:hypothetical protein